MYLVMLRHTMDDFPIRLFSEKGPAIEFAKTLSWEVPDDVRTVFNMNASTPCVINVLRFVNDRPFEIVFWRCREDEDDDDPDEDEELLTPDNDQSPRLTPVGAGGR